jgi:type IV secretion system protein VirB10
MANIDPFQSLPTIEPDGEPEHTAAFAEPAPETAAEVASASPPRNLIKTATKYAVPIFIGATLVWLFFSPNNPRAGKLVEKQKVDVNADQQTQESASMFKKLKSEAEKSRPAVVVPVMPGSAPAAAAFGPTVKPVAGAASAQIQPSLPPPRPDGYSSAATASPSTTYATPPAPSYTAQGYPAAAPMPTAMSEDATKEAQKRIAEQLKRQEDVRAAPLEAGQVRLLTQGGPTEAPKTPTVVSDLQADIAGERARALSAGSQQALQAQMLAAMTPTEPVKSKGANEDFLANASSSSAARPQVASLQSAAGRYLVGEGSVIRAVLLTNVKSELPGRILARITSDVYDSTQRHVVIPKGSLINGVYNSQVIVGQERLLMAMTRLTLPNGNWIPLAGAGATDMMGTSGVDAEVNNHFMKMFGSSLIIGASTLLLPRADSSVTTLPGTTGASGAATAGSVFATTLNDVLKTLLDRNKSIAPTLSLAAGQEFIFMANQDMLMAPYQ